MRHLETTGLDDTDHLAVIGAGSLAQALTRVTPQASLIGKPAGWMQTVSPQGVSVPNEELDYLPLSAFDYTNGGATPVDVEDSLTALPQRPFRGERLVLQALYITAGAGGGVADALYRLIITPALFVGAVQIGASQGAMPGSAFAANAFGVRLSFPVAGQGSRVYLPFKFAAVGAGDSISIAGGIFGRAVR